MNGPNLYIYMKLLYLTRGSSLIATKFLDALNLFYGQSITLYFCLIQWLHYYVQRGKNWFYELPTILIFIITNF